MLENVKIYTSDKVWTNIFADLGIIVVDSQKMADVVFDDIDLKLPISINDLKNILLGAGDNKDIICKIFGKYVVLPNLQHRIVISLYKNPNITMRELKDNLGLTPDITTHTVETAIYQLRKKYGHNFIENTDGKYKIGQI